MGVLALVGVAGVVGWEEAAGAGAGLEGPAVVAAVLTDGTHITSVVHLGRHPTALQRTALQATGARCARLGCEITGIGPVDVATVRAWMTDAFVGR